MDGLIVKGADMGMGLEPDDDDGLIGLEYYEQEATTYQKQKRKAVCPFVPLTGLDSIYRTLKSRSNSRIDTSSIHHMLLLLNGYHLSHYKSEIY